MNPERWRQIDELLDAVLELPEIEREAFLSAKCDGDEELKNEVLSLLRAESASAGNFMEHSAMDLMAQEIAGRSRDFDSNLPAGKELGNYKIEKQIGSGGMGDVFLAQDTRLNRKVALKILPAEFVSDPERIRRFEREARAISALNHPYIVTVFDVGEIDGINYIATEYVEGKTVRQLINEGASDLKQTLAVISQICEALAAAHLAGIIHRDIKPENIMLRADGYAKVLDFGLAKLTEQAEPQNSFLNYTLKGVIIGTPSYMSPEQISDEKVDHRTDLWSVGVVLYEMLTGANPFKRETRQETFQAILSETPPLVTNLKPNLPAELNRILEKALEKDADLSYQTASDLRADLKRVRREIDSSPSVRSGSLAQKDGRISPRKKLVPFALALLPLLLVVIAVGWYFLVKTRNSLVETPQWNKAVVAQLTDFSGVESHPSLSPDGKNLLFTREIDGNKDIFRLRIGGSNAQNLTADSPEIDTEAAFSPDGEQIAFRSNRDGGGIFLMGATGESVRRLTDFGYNPAWSPDGKEIVFSTIQFTDAASRDLVGEIWRVNLASGEKRRIETGGADAIQPQFSPNGKRIVFWSVNQNFQRDLKTIPSQGGQAVNLTDDAALDWNPIWSPDGKFVYFCSNRNGGAGIWQIRVGEETGEKLGEPEAVTAPLAQSWMLTVSRDGGSLVYVRRQSIENIQRAEFDPVKKQIVGKPVSVTQSTRRARAADVSPDGETLVFYTVTDTQEDIFISRLDGSKQNQLTNDVAKDRVPRFSADGKQIAFYSDASGNYEIWTIKTDGGERRQLTSQGGRGLRYPFFAPDGKRLGYSTMEGGLQFLELDKKWSEQKPFQAPPLNAKGDWFVGWDWSPDGKKIAGWRGDALEGEIPGVYVYEIDSNRYEKICDACNRPAWLADNRHLLVGRDRKLFLLDSQTKTERELLSFAPQFGGSPKTTPDNRMIFFTVETLEGDIQMLSLK